MCTRKKNLQQTALLTGNITIPSKVTYSGTTYSGTAIGTYAFFSCLGLTSISIPSGVSTIGDYAFSSCEALSSLEISNSVIDINHYAFVLCELESIKVNATVPPALNDEPFYGLDTSIPVYVPASAVETYKNDSDWKIFTNIIGMSDK